MNGERDDLGSVALYWDFENLHASLYEERAGEGAYSKPDNRFKLQEPLVDVQAVVELAASFGSIAINRAYCNWQYYGRYVTDSLRQHAGGLAQGSGDFGYGLAQVLVQARSVGHRQGRDGTALDVQNWEADDEQSAHLDAGY